MVGGVKSKRGALSSAEEGGALCRVQLWGEGQGQRGGGAVWAGLQSPSPKPSPAFPRRPDQPSHRVMDISPSVCVWSPQARSGRRCQAGEVRCRGGAPCLYLLTQTPQPRDLP